LHTLISAHLLKAGAPLRPSQFYSLCLTINNRKLHAVALKTKCHVINTKITDFHCRIAKRVTGGGVSRRMLNVISKFQTNGPKECVQLEPSLSPSLCKLFASN